MTPKEMLQMRIDGATFQEIADKCGISRQAAHESIKLYIERLTTGKRGRGFSYKQIKYKGIAEYFKANEYETVTAFTLKVIGYRQKVSMMRQFLTGEVDSFFTISQIKRMCEICGKTFEETFEERDDECQVNADQV